MTFEIKLPENSSTGFKWRVVTNPESQMVISQTSDVFKHSKSTAVGSGGEHIFQYQATNIGMVEIYGFHARPWEINSGTSPSVQYKIIVR